MNFNEYSAYFESIVNTPADEQRAPYDNPDYFDYTKINWARMNRWFKTGKLTAEMVETVKKIDKKQEWIVITEPWCGDAAHNVPFIEMVARENPLISVTYQLRDAEPYLIDQYLTNGTKSIPKLVMRDEEGNDIGVWGPRPAGCQRLYLSLKDEEAPFDKVKVEIQNWYNANKGVEIQNELIQVISQLFKLA